MAGSKNQTQVMAARLLRTHSGGDTAESTDDTTEKRYVVEQSTVSTTWSHVEDIERFIANEGLGRALDQFSESTAYTFAISDYMRYFQDRKILFLGETDNFQAWARLKLYLLKPDEVEYLRFSFLSDTSKVEHNISGLPINMYPFGLVANQGSNLAREELMVLVRYVFREAAGINLPFSLEARSTFRSALVFIQKAIETAGGIVYKLTNIGPPTRLPKSLSYTLSDDSSTNRPEAMEAGTDESVAHRASERSKPRNVFEVSAQPKIKKPVMNKVQPKPKVKPQPKPKSKSTAAVVPAKRWASEAGDGDTERYRRLRDLEEEQAGIEIEKVESSDRQADRKREEIADMDRLLELRARGQAMDEVEGRLLKGKSAQWLLACQ
ncbi:uncharacterized protein EKO05_0009791 [Ascochyta rabiei]|uniref:Uncharacterized protein n=1 Tax=Didymella rabiei TaxID=5454 RepID=A0A163DUM2_DIDRA|nr:uncharacterized protein EKO05_0009791 [Ascochyta rabiei]KZM23361.1 hypothetical protein ST47_g5461 [Ascochyta rabiei]UPX19531.1 hypothetical protein EKO05_0009791 [Ascochyta rabiei]